MGNMLSSPLTSKGLHRVGNEKLKVAACEMQGYRLTMEDAHSIVLDFTPNSSFLGVFDGHGVGGEYSSEWFAKNLPNFIKEKNSLKKKDITRACLEADQAFIEESKKTNRPYKETGTTAIFCIIEEPPKPKNPSKPYRLTVGNIGDSRCLLLRDGEIQSITEDHKPGNEGETKRIISAGGHVANGRVDGVLAISRALGDHTFKDNQDILPEKQRVIAVPDIHTIDGVGGDDVLFMLCDGIYEGSSNEAAVSLLNKFMKEHPDDPAIALSLLFDKQLNNSQDNMSSILIQFKDGSKYSSLSEQGEIEYVPCEMQIGPEFSKAFTKFAQRFGDVNPKKQPRGRRGSKQEPSQKEEGEKSKKRKTEKKRSTKRRKTEAPVQKDNTAEGGDTDTDTDQGEEGTASAGPRRSSRLQLSERSASIVLPTTTTTTTTTTIAITATTTLEKKNSIRRTKS